MIVVWEAVTADELELPIAQADTLKELADMLGLNFRTLNNRKANIHKKDLHIKIHKIEIEEDD